MKRIVVVAILVMLASGPIVAEDITDNWSSYFEAGDTSVSLGVGFGAWSLFSIATYPGIEQTIMDFKIADVVPMSIGAAIKGVANIYAGSGYAGVNVGAGLFVPFHFSLRGLDIPPLQSIRYLCCPRHRLQLRPRQLLRKPVPTRVRHLRRIQLLRERQFRCLRRGNLLGLLQWRNYRSSAEAVTLEAEG